MSRLSTTPISILDLAPLRSVAPGESFDAWMQLDIMVV